MPRVSPGSASRGWSAGSIITATRRSNSSPTSSARRAQLLAGGRYDGLVETLGGPHTPAIGWAAGIERLAMMIDAPDAEKPDAVLVPIGERG